MLSVAFCVCHKAILCLFEVQRYYFFLNFPTMYI